MKEEINFKNISVGDLIKYLQKIPEDYKVCLYELTYQQREYEINIELFHEERTLEIY